MFDILNAFIVALLVLLFVHLLADFVFLALLKWLLRHTKRNSNLLEETWGFIRLGSTGLDLFTILSTGLRVLLVFTLFI